MVVYSHTAMMTRACHRGCVKIRHLFFDWRLICSVASVRLSRRCRCRPIVIGVINVPNTVLARGWWMILCGLHIRYAVALLWSCLLIP